MVGMLDTDVSMDVVRMLERTVNGLGLGSWRKIEIKKSREGIRNRASQPQPTNQSVLFPFQIRFCEYSLRYFDVEPYVLQQELSIGVLTQLIHHLY